MKCGGSCEDCQLDQQTLQKGECKKAATYDPLKTGMVSGPAQVFTRYDEKDKISCVWRSEEIEKEHHRL